jgi:hypothetical protein
MGESYADLGATKASSLSVKPPNAGPDVTGWNLSGVGILPLNHRVGWHRFASVGDDNNSGHRYTRDFFEIGAGYRF